MHGKCKAWEVRLDHIKENPKTFLTPDEAARFLNLERGTIYNLILRGRLSTERLPGNRRGPVVIPVEDVLSYKAFRRRRGRVDL